MKSSFPFSDFFFFFFSFFFFDLSSCSVPQAIDFVCTVFHDALVSTPLYASWVSDIFFSSRVLAFVVAPFLQLLFVEYTQTSSSFFFFLITIFRRLILLRTENPLVHLHSILFL